MSVPASQLSDFSQSYPLRQPVVQSRTGRNCNCIQACVASVLEVSANSVPDFSKKRTDTFCYMRNWCYAARGYVLIRGGCATVPGADHMVVGYAIDGKLGIVWDPNPAGRGLIDVRDTIVFANPLIHY